MCALQLMLHCNSYQTQSLATVAGTDENRTPTTSGGDHVGIHIAGQKPDPTHSKWIVAI